MKVSELIARLQMMPQELEVMLPCESGVDHAREIGITQVAKTERDWSGTPVGNYRVVDETDTEGKTGNLFPVVVIRLDATGSVTELKGMFGKPKKTVSIEEMNAAIAAAAARAGC